MVMIILIIVNNINNSDSHFDASDFKHHTLNHFAKNFEWSLDQNVKGSQYSYIFFRVQ